MALAMPKSMSCNSRPESSHRKAEKHSHVKRNQKLSRHAELHEQPNDVLTHANIHTSAHVWGCRTVSVHHNVLAYTCHQLLMTAAAS